MNDRVTTPLTPESLTGELLAFVNDTLPGLDRRGNIFAPVRRDTALFEGGVLDSLSILHLIVAVERLTARTIPDEMVVMKHFRSIDSIVEAFGDNPAGTPR